MKNTAGTGGGVGEELARISHELFNLNRNSNN
jgi:hypothetical protein